MRKKKRLRNILSQSAIIIVLSIIIFVLFLLYNNSGMNKKYYLQQEIAYKTCLADSEFYDKQFCVERKLIIAAENEIDLNYCQLIEDDYRHENCRESVAFLKALKEKDSRECDILIFPASCKTDYFKERAKNQTDLSFLDDEIENKSMRDDIHDYLILERVVASGNCSRLRTDSGIEYCEQELAEPRFDSYDST
jgi:hypothetical protein